MSPPDLLADLERNADTFADLAMTLTLLGRPTLADACRVAEQSNREAIAKAAAAPDLVGVLKKINEWCCFASEEDTSARLEALVQIGIHARAAILAFTGEAA